MKILYVTGMAGPLKDILSGKTESEITHSPGFFHPWYKLVQRGHQVDFVVASNFNQEPNIKVDWFSEKNIYANIYDPFIETHWIKRIFRRIKRFTKLLYFTNKAVSENNYDFIYCKAFYEGLAGNIIANLRGVPCGMRSMGTILPTDFDKHGVKGTAIRRPAEYMTFKMKKEFFIMTDDGSRGDQVYEQWKPARKKYDYLFWKTGVNKEMINKSQSSAKIPEHDYLFFAARFDGWKRHDRILKVLHECHQRKCLLHLYFAGGIQSQKYYQSIQSLVKKYGLEKHVHFLGPIKQETLKLLAYNAIANPLMYDVSNLGNVFFESFSIGSVMVGINDGTLDEYIVNGENGFIVEDENEASVVVERLLNDKDLEQNVRLAAVRTADKTVLSIDERFDREVDLIEKYAVS